MKILCCARCKFVCASLECLGFGVIMVCHTACGVPVGAFDAHIEACVAGKYEKDSTKCKVGVS